MGGSSRTRTVAPAGAMPQTKMMRAAALDRFGGPDVLTLHELPLPTLGPNDVLIALDTAGVGSWDADIRDGWNPPGTKLRFPLVLGVDGAGTVAAVGSRVRRFKTGDEVYAYSWQPSRGGFYAQYVAVPADNVAPIPKSLDIQQAGAIAATGLTALQGIDDALRVKKGEAIIVHGASGGVGSLAVQFAKLRGARVLGTARSKQGIALVRELGAHEAVNTTQEDLAEAARRFAPDGVDAIYALAGGDELERAIETLRPKTGRVAYPHGIEPEPRKRRGLDVRTYDAAGGVKEFQRLNRAVDAAKLRVPIAATFRLAAAAKSHERIAKGQVLGKIVLRMR